MNNDLRIALRSEYVAALQQITAQRLVVVYLPVERQPNASVLVAHRLRTGRTEINDCESSVAQQDASVSQGLDTPAIRTTMRKCVEHISELSWG